MILCPAPQGFSRFLFDRGNQFPGGVLGVNPQESQ